MLTQRAGKTKVGGRDLAPVEAGEQRCVLDPTRTKQRRGRGLAAVRDPPKMKRAATDVQLGRREQDGSEAREVVELHAYVARSRSCGGKAGSWFRQGEM